MSDERNEEAVMAVVLQWGESFEDLARDERFEFEPDCIHVSLWKPITKDSAITDRLRFTEPTIDLLSLMDRATGEMAKVRVLVKQACTLSDREVGSIGFRDLNQLTRLIKAFTQAGRETGG